MILEYNFFMRRLYLFIILVVACFTTVFFVKNIFGRQTATASGKVLCGNGSEADGYGFSYNLQQPHWTVDGERYVSDETLDRVDVILDQLDADSIAQTMILFQRQDQVGNRVNCAVHFLRYMKLGLLEGPRKDNGFVFLIVVDDGKIDVHYGVGLGLPALTAHNLTNLNRLAEETYNSTGSMDQALLTLVEGFNEYARSQYAPYYKPTATPVVITLPTLPGGSTGIAVVCCMVCIGIIILIILIMALRNLGRWFPPSSGGGGSLPWGGGSSWRWWRRVTGRRRQWTFG